MENLCLYDETRNPHSKYVKLCMWASFGLKVKRLRGQYGLICSGEMISETSIRKPGHFGGIISGTPCQAFSRLRYLLEYNGYQLSPHLIPEFESCVEEAQVAWFVMENAQHGSA